MSYRYCVIRNVARPTTALQNLWSWFQAEAAAVDCLLSFLDDSPPVNLSELADVLAGPYCHVERISSLNHPYIVKLDRHILFQDSNLDANDLFSAAFLEAYPDWTKQELYSNLLCVYHKADVGVSSAKSEKALFLTEVCAGNDIVTLVGYSPKLFNRELLAHVLREVLGLSGK